MSHHGVFPAEIKPNSCSNEEPEDSSSPSTARKSEAGCPLSLPLPLATAAASATPQIRPLALTPVASCSVTLTTVRLAPCAGDPSSTRISPNLLNQIGSPDCMSHPVGRLFFHSLPSLLLNLQNDGRVGTKQTHLAFNAWSSDFSEPRSRRKSRT